MAVSTTSPAEWVRFAILIALATTLSGCRTDTTTPEGALRQFINNVQIHRADEVYDGLSAASRAELHARARAQAEATGAEPVTDRSQLLFRETQLIALRKPESISVASPLGTEVTVRVSVEGGQTAEVKMVREGTTWKVDLFDSLQASPDPGRTGPSSTTATTADTGLPLQP